ncbi:MAG: LysR family transcriptional regulator [Pseudomonadota bacterium]
MELRQLQTFRAVAESLSFTRAAEALSYAQSSVTGQIQSLEEELGVRLFERLGKRIALTPQGEQLLAYAERILKLAEEARQTVTRQGEEPSGPLLIGSPESLATYRLPPILQRFRQRYPRVQLVLKPGVCSDMLRQLSDGLLDLAFIMQEPLSAPQLVSRSLKVEPLYLFCPPDHPLAARPGVTLSDLQGQHLLLTEEGCSYRILIEQELEKAGVRVASSLEFGSIEAIKQCVAAGMGLAVLPAMAAGQDLTQGRLAMLPWREASYSVVTQVVWHKDKWLSPAMQAFIDLTLEILPPLPHLQTAAPRPVRIAE